MADEAVEAVEAVVHIGENSPEYVAYQLLTHIAAFEEKAAGRFAEIKAERKWILDTYAECLEAVKDRRVR